MFKFTISFFLYYFLALTSATGSAVLLDDMGFTTSWYHIVLMFIVFNITMHTLLHINDCSFKFSNHLKEHLE